jgi:ABC-type Mn2+/Zn2+ transport system permease subunit/ABC-type Zn uptake system ZnuABC Zn-binding protein ZnuA
VSALLLDPFAYAFFGRAMLAGVLVGAMCGALSSFVVLRRMSYIGHGLAHAVVGGVGVGVALGVDLYVGAAAATVLSALLIDRVARRRGLHADAAIGIVTTAIFAVGIATLSVVPTRVNLESLLFGNILGVDRTDLWVAAAIGLGFAGVLVVLYKRLVLTTFDPEVAAVHGVRTGALELAFSLTTAAVVVASVRVLGVLLIAAAVVVPAASARLLTRSFGPMLLLATAIGVASSVAGLYASFHVNVPSGPTIVLAGSLVFTVAFLATALRDRRALARTRAAAASALVALLLAGCAVGGAPSAPVAGDRTEDAPDADAPEDDTAPAPADPAGQEPVLRVLATVAPIADLVAEVGGDRVEVSSLVPPGADSHTYEPRPSDVALLGEVDAYVGVGLDLNEGAIGLAEQHLPEGAPIVLLGELALDRDALVLDHTHDDGQAHGDDGHTHGDDGHTHGDDGHTHGDDGGLGPNPHVWTSVRNAAAMVPTIAEELTALDPEGEAVYAANADGLLAELADLDEDIEAAVATVPAENRTLITYHDAWTYFARDHGLEFVAAVQPGDYSEPSAAELRAVIDLLRERDVPAVFGSEVFPTRVLDTIASETGAVYVGDLSDDALPGAAGAPEHTYVEMMRRNAIVIVDALGGDRRALER